MTDEYKDVTDGLVIKTRRHIDCDCFDCRTLALLKRYREGLEKLSSKNAFFPAWELETILRESKNPFEEDGKLRINYAKQILGGSDE